MEWIIGLLALMIVILAGALMHRIGKLENDILKAHKNIADFAETGLPETLRWLKLEDRVMDIRKVYGERLDMHSKEMDEIKGDVTANRTYSEAGIELNRYLSDKLAERVNIIDEIQDEELCFAEDTAYELGLLYDHLGLTIKTKEKKNGEITKKVVEVK